MPLTWNGNEQITVSNDPPFASSGPALAVLNNELVMIYSHKGDLRFSTTTALSPAWSSDEQIVIHPQNPRTRYRPTAVEANGSIHTIYTGVSGGDLWWSWYNGNWSGNIQLPFIDQSQAVPTTITQGDPQPTLTFFNNHLHLVWHNFLASFTNQTGQFVAQRNDIWYSSLDVRLPLQLSSWSPPVRVAVDANYPSVVAFNETLYLFCSNAPPPGIITISSWLSYAKLSGSTFSALEFSVIAGQQPQVRDGVTGVLFDQLVYLIYRGVGGRDIWYATMDAAEHFDGNIQIEMAHSTPRTQNFVGAAQFSGHLCLAYQGEVSDRVYFAYTS